MCYSNSHIIGKMVSLDDRGRGRLHSAAKVTCLMTRVVRPVERVGDCLMGSQQVNGARVGLETQKQMAQEKTTLFATVIRCVRVPQSMGSTLKLPRLSASPQPEEL